MQDEKNIRLIITRIIDWQQRLSCNGGQEFACHMEEGGISQRLRSVRTAITLKKISPCEAKVLVADVVSDLTTSVRSIHGSPCYNQVLTGLQETQAWYLLSTVSSARSFRGLY